MRWRMELSCYNFDIVYWPGKKNISPDTLSWGNCNAMNSGSLAELNQALCHPGVTRMFNFIKSWNLSYSMEDVKTMNRLCHICAEHKPRFYKSEPANLIKASQPFEQLNINFQDPLASNNNNRYFLTGIDGKFGCANNEYSRFSFIFPCKYDHRNGNQMFPWALLHVRHACLYTLRQGSCLHEYRTA